MQVGKIPTVPGGPHNKRVAERLLKQCLVSGEVIPTKHFREKLNEENLSFQDALLVLRHGTIFDAPESDIKTGEWKYRIEHAELGGKWLVIVFCFNGDDRVRLITVFSK